jgi:acetate---CoA ligase (ADP-forming)
MIHIEQTVQDIGRIFNARSVAVVGASGNPSKFGYMTMDSLLRAGYEGDVYPVNPKHAQLFGLKTYPSLTDVPGTVDVVVVIVPADAVPGVLREATVKGCVGAVIMTGGFREAGRTDLEEEILSIARHSRLRLLGPNIQGINYLPNKFCPMFFPVITKRGPLAVISQSGTIAAALSEWAEKEGLGISAAVNLGNQLDLCESDYLDYFADDQDTKAIAMYLEGVKDGKRFLETIQRVAPKKPVAILKSARTTAGRKSAASHTGSLAGSNEVFKAACRKFGVTYVEDLETLFDSTKALATLRRPRGNRVLTISTSGGAGTLAVDEAIALGLSVPELPQSFKDDLKRLFISPLATLSNPLDLASITADHFRQVVSLADQHNVADIFLLNYGDPVVGATEVTQHLAAHVTATVVVSYMAGGEEERSSRVRMQESSIPVFSTPQRAMRAVAAAVRSAQFHPSRRESPSESPSIAKREPPPATGDRRFLTETEAIKYLEQYDIPYPDHGFATSAKEAVAIAKRIGYPVALKIVSPQVVHKSDVGGVLTGLGNGREVACGFIALKNRVAKALPDASIEGVLVCQQAPQGLDVIVGGLKDPVLGSAVMFGLGGIFTEVIQDVSFGLVPLSRRDAHEMIREIRGYPLLVGARGQKGYDIEQLAELLLTVSRMIAEQRFIRELDLNPIRLFKKGLTALDVRIIKEDC